MADLTLNAVEEAVVEALKAELAPQVPFVATYQGKWQEDLQQQGWRLPAALVMLRQVSSEQAAMGSADLILDFTVLIVVRPLRGEAQARLEAGGLYQMLEGVRRALWLKDLGLAITPFSLEREEPLLVTRELAVFGADYSTSLIKNF